MELFEITDASPDRMIISERVFHTPLLTVFKAWTDPQHLAQWWGPKGFTNTFHEFDPRPGGNWKLTMHGPEKGNYPNESVFVEIVPNKKIVWNRISNPLFQGVVLFYEEGNGTRVVYKMIFGTAEECDKLIKFVPEKNEENFDKLEEELSKM
ncbi:MAG: SRPBCC family protein [Bacteroidota bacterium]